MKYSQKGVQNALANYLFEMFQGRGPRQEHVRKTTKRENRYIECALKQNDHLSLQDITNITGFPISRWTVARRRSEAELSSYIAAEKPGLQPENIAARLEWANKYKDWTVED